MSDRSEMPGVDIVIPIYGQAGLLRRCVETVLATTSRQRVILVDDCSPGDEIAALYREWQGEPRLLLARTPQNLGFIGATRYGAGLGKAPYILFLNSDTEAITPGWLEAMLPASEDIAVVGARLVFPPDLPGPAAGGLQHAGVARGPQGVPYHPFLGRPASGPEGRQVLDVNAVTGACFLVRRSAWDRLGGWDDRFGRGVYEDVDFCWRVKAAGMRVLYQPAACLYHRESASSDSDGSHRLNAHQQENLTRLLEKWNHPGNEEAIFFGEERVRRWQRARAELAQAAQLAAKRQNPQALEAARRAVEVGVDLPEAFMGYAELLSQAQRHAESARMLAEAVRLAPCHWDARLHWIDELAASRQVERACQELRALQPVFPRHPAVQSRFQRLNPLLETGRAQARRLLDELLDAGDIVAAIEAHRAEVSRALYGLVCEDRAAAQAAGDLDLAEGLGDLAAYIDEICSQQEQP